MLSPTRALKRSQAVGAPLPPVDAFTRLHEGHFKFRFRAGQVTLVAGQPASFKSSWVLFMVAQMNLPTIYISADMSQREAMSRYIAALTGESTESVARGLSAGASDYYADALESARVHFSFDSDPSMDTVEREVDAWVEMYDEWPQVIVLDNLLDIMPAGGADEFSGYKSVLLDAKRLARTTDASVIVLHHMSEGASDPTMPAPRKAVMGKVSQTPANVLSIAADGDQFKVSVVKHRLGKQDPTGVVHEVFRVDPERNQFFGDRGGVRAPVVHWEEGAA